MAESGVAWNDGGGATATTSSSADPATVSVSNYSGCGPAAEQGPTTGYFIFSATSGCGSSSSSGVSVTYALSGTASNAAGVDYNSVLAALTLYVPYASQKWAPFTPVDDALVEATETVVVSGLAAPGHTVVQGSATQSIIDNDTLVSVAAPDANASETHDGDPIDQGLLVITREGGDHRSPLSVDISTSSGTATQQTSSSQGGDYTLKTLSGTLIDASVMIAANQASVTVVLTALLDAAIEGEEIAHLDVIPRSTSSSGQTVYGVPPPTTSPSRNPASAPVRIRDGEIGPDAGQASVTGDVVPSIQANAARKHYVSPKQNGSHVVLKAGVPVGQAFGMLYKWGGDGEAVAGSPEKRRVSRNATGRFEVKLLNAANDVVLDTMVVWVVWADLTATPAIAPVLQVVENVNPPAGVAEGPGSRISATFDFEAVIQPPAIITDDDRPDFAGVPTSHVPRHNAPHVLDANAFGQPLTKWDISRQMRLRMLSPTIGTNDIRHARGTIWANLPDPNKLIQTTPAPAADGYPNDDREGNDDTNDPQRESNNPYSEISRGRLSDSDPVRLLTVLNKSTLNRKCETVAERLLSPVVCHVCHFRFSEDLFRSRWYRTRYSGITIAFSRVRATRDQWHLVPRR